jgi:hypothetical protein
MLLIVAEFRQALETAIVNDPFLIGLFTSLPPHNPALEVAVDWCSDPDPSSVRHSCYHCLWST